jgi:hypothetical protein
MQLPNPDQALIPFEKLEGYSLNSNHPEGRHKAIVFRSALDIGLEEAEELRLALKPSCHNPRCIAGSSNALWPKISHRF